MEIFLSSAQTELRFQQRTRDKAYVLPVPTGVYTNETAPATPLPRARPPADPEASRRIT